VIGILTLCKNFKKETEEGTSKSEAFLSWVLFMTLVLGFIWYLAGAYIVWSTVNSYISLHRFHIRDVLLDTEFSRRVKQRRLPPAPVLWLGLGVTIFPLLVLASSCLLCCFSNNRRQNNREQEDRNPEAYV